jgi:peptidyl-tRNA hydrolase
LETDFVEDDHVGGPMVQPKIAHQLQGQVVQQLDADFVWDDHVDGLLQQPKVALQPQDALQRQAQQWEHLEQPKVALQVQGALELRAVQQFDLHFVEQDDQLCDVDQ